jgi:hypothetical protein
MNRVEKLSRELEVEPKISKNADQDNEKNTCRYPTICLPERPYCAPSPNDQKPWKEEAEQPIGGGVSKNSRAE